MNWIKIKELRLMMKFYNSNLKDLSKSFEYIGRKWIDNSPIIIYKFK